MSGPLRQHDGAFQVFALHGPDMDAAQPHLHPEGPVLPGLSEPAKESLFSPRAKQFAKAAAFFTAALMLRLAPLRPSAYKLIPTDWKQWAKVALGITGIKHLNEGLGWKPPVWLGAIQTVAILNPLLQGVSKASMGQLALLIPMVAGLVEGTKVAGDKLEPSLHEQFQVPPVLTRIALSVGTTILGIFAFHKVYNTAALKGLLGEEAKMLAASGTLAAVPVCTRCGGCASVVCASEVGDFVGSLKDWLHGKHNRPEEVPQ